MSQNHFTMLSEGGGMGRGGSGVEWGEEALRGGREGGRGWWGGRKCLKLGLCVFRIVANPGTTPITILAVNSDHGLSFLFSTDLQYF